MSSALGEQDAAPVLFGRDAESAAIRDRLASIGAGGGALLVVGEPGVGKTALLDAAGEQASSDGVDVLTVTGVDVESTLPFAGLHHLLRNLLGGLDRLPQVRAQALRTVFGLVDGAPPEPFLIGLAVLDLLNHQASERSILVLVDDAQWLDQETSAVLAFVARRLTADPVLLVAATRPGHSTTLIDSITDRLGLGPVDDASAAALLQLHAPGLSATSRRQVLRWAAGNPLALLELPEAIGHTGGRLLHPTRSGQVPTTERLRSAFATRALNLPDAARAILLIAATNDSDDFAEALAAASGMTGSALNELDAAPAVRAGLLRINAGTVHFRHPLVRTAVRDEADPMRRQAAHRSLAAVLAGRRDRQAWHLAAATSTPDDDLAAELESIATRARRRGGMSVALAAQWRAITLTADSAARSRRAVTGAELAFEFGDRSLLEQLLSEVQEADLDLVGKARVELLTDVFDFRPWSSADLLAVAQRAEDLAGAGHPDVALRLLSSALARALLGNAEGVVLRRLVEVADGLGLPPDHPGLLSLYAHADPAGRGAAVRDRVSRALAARDATTGPDTLFALARAAGAAGDAHTQLQAIVPAIALLREAGRLSVAVPALWTQSTAAWFTGDWAAGTAAAAEAAALAQETSQPLWAAAARLTESSFAAVGGDLLRARELIDATAAEQPGFSRHQLERAEGLLALAGGRFEAAHARLGTILTPGHPAFHQMARTAVVSEFAEAAAACGRRADALVLVRDVADAAGRSPSPLVQAALTLATALLVDEGDAEALFAVATAPTAESWPFLFGRAHLAQGAWLRRNRQVGASRVSLRLARQVFDRLGAAPWSDRARRELRAAGEPTGSARTPPPTQAVLTPQELQVATLAAQGLTNRQIGEQLFLSHRTVSTYLYQVHPKLGIATRGQLAGVLRPWPPAD